MDIPVWAEFYGETTLPDGSFYSGYFSRDRYEFQGPGEERDSGVNKYPISAWETDCGWKFSPVNVCLENK